MEIISEKLKELIDNNGPEYLAKEPYNAYKELLRSKAADRKTAGALLMLFTTVSMKTVKSEKDPDQLSKRIQKDCAFNKKMADLLADIMISLYSRENKKEWESKNLAGLDSFRKEKLSIKWNGFATWHVNGGGVDCYYDADIILKPAKGLVINDELQRLLKKNSFVEASEIAKLFEKNLKEYLDREFDDYCTCDDYYEPVVEDFELESYVKDWCKENGFKLISCEGEGRDSGYEPDSVRRWLKY